MKKENLSNDAVIITTGKMITKLTEIVVSLVLVRFLTKSDYGTYRQVWLVYATISGILLLGIPRSIYYFVPTLPEDRKRTFMFQTIILLSAASLITSVIIFYFSGYIAEYFHNPAAQYYLKIFAIYIFFSLSSSYFSSYLYSERKARLVTMLSMIGSFSFGLCVVLSLIFTRKLEFVFLSMGIIMGCQYILYLLYAMKKIWPIKIFWDKKMLHEQFKYSMPLGLTSIIWMIGKHIDSLIVAFFVSPEIFAVFAVGAIEIPVFNMLNDSINTVLRVKFAELYKKGDCKELVRIWHSSIKKQALIYFPLFFCLFIFADKFLTLLYTDKYTGSVLFFRIYLFLLPLRVATYSLILTSIGKTKPVMYGALGYFIFNVVASIMSIKIIGIAGPAVITVLATVLVSLYYLMLEKAHLKMSFTELFPVRLLSKIAFFAAIPAIFAYPVRLLSLSKLHSLLVGWALYCAMYALVCFKFNIIESDEKKLILSWLTLKPLWAK